MTRPGAPSGERHPRAVLTDAQVRDMRNDRDAGMSIKGCADKYGCPYWTAVDILLYRTRAFA